LISQKQQIKRKKKCISIRKPAGMIECVPEKIERRKVETEYHQNNDQEGTEFFPFLNGGIEKIIR